MFDPQQTPASAGAQPEAPADAPSPSRPGLPLDPGRLLRAVRSARRVVLAGGLAGGLVGGLAARTFVHRHYSSHVALAFEPAASEGPGSESAGGDEARTLRTLADTVKLTPNLDAIRERLRRAERIEQLAARIEVESSTETRLLVVRTTGDSPEEAARLADTTCQVFLSSRVELERARLRERVRMATDDATHARESLEHARATYDEFRTAHGITDLPAERLAAVERVARLRAESDAARAEFDAETARQRALETAARAQPPTAVLSESETRLGAVRLAESEADLAASAARLSSEHPRVQALSAQVDALRSRVDSTVRTGRVIGPNPRLEALRATTDVVLAQRESARRRGEVLGSLADEALQRARELSDAEGRAAALLAVVRAEETHLAQVQSVLRRAEDALREPSSGLRILAPAVVPDRPTKSHRRLVTVGVAVVAMLLALVGSVLRALWGLRIFAPGELAFWGNGPVVGASPWKGEPRDAALETLREDLDEVLGAARGTTLVVAAGASEQSLAQALADELSRASRDETPGAPETERVSRAPNQNTTVRAFETPENRSALRRAARSAARVLFVVKSGEHSALALAGLRTALGRAASVGFVLVGVGTDLADAPDRVGPVSSFVQGTPVAPRTHDAPARRTSAPTEASAQQTAPLHAEA